MVSSIETTLAVTLTSGGLIQTSGESFGAND